MNHLNLTRISIALAVSIVALLFPRVGLSQSVEIGDYQADAKDVMRILGIRHLGASVTLPEPVKPVEATVRLDFYKQGQRLGNLGRSTTFGFGEGAQAFEISVDFADTDKTALPGARPGNFRFFVKLRNAGPDGSELNSVIDVSKTEFNAEPGGSSGFIAKNQPEVTVTEDGTTEVPLLIYITGGMTTTMHMETLKDTLAANPDADVLVVVLVYKKYLADRTVASADPGE